MGDSEKINQFLKEKNHPLTIEMELIRSIILSTDERIEETIKWSSPTFIFKGNIASFMMNGKKHVSLIFHKGARLKDEHGLLEGDGKEARVARFLDEVDIEKKKIALQTVIKDWIMMMDG